MEEVFMGTSKPIDELTIEDFKRSPIWEWALEEEENEDQDETWVRPAETQNFTEELNGSIVLGEMTTNIGVKFPMMCSLNLEEDEAVISSVVFYYDKEDDYHALEDWVNNIALPLLIKIEIIINGEQRTLMFIANKVDIYKKNIRTKV